MPGPETILRTESIPWFRSFSVGQIGRGLRKEREFGAKRHREEEGEESERESRYKMRLQLVESTGESEKGSK